MAETLSVSDTWLLTDGKAGNLRQAQALADWLQRPAHAVTVSLSAPWRWLSPWAMRAPSNALQPPMSPPWPALAIGCGRIGAAALDALPDANNGGPRRIQILDPHIAPNRFDAVIVPEHDGLQGDNVITLTGSLHSVDAAWLQRQRQQQPEWADCDAPRTLLLLGGPRRGTGFGTREMCELRRIVEHWQARDAGCLWISLSGRTPAAWRRLVESFLPRLGAHRLWRGTEDGANPYPGWLAHADRIIVTPDSVNMLSEACATGTPVLTHAPHGVRGRLGELHRSLREHGALRPLQLSVRSWRYAPLNEGPRAVEALRRLPALRQLLPPTP